MKTNKQELLAKHKELLDKAEELRQQIENIGKVVELLPEPENDIYWITGAGTYHLSGVEDSEEVIAQYNYFDTKEEAEEEAALTRARRKLQKLAKALNGEWKPDWSDTSGKYIIFYSHPIKSYVTAFVFSRQAMGIHFSSEENAQRALEELTEDEKKILFRREV